MMRRTVQFDGGTKEVLYCFVVGFFAPAPHWSVAGVVVRHGFGTSTALVSCRCFGKTWFWNRRRIGQLQALWQDMVLKLQYAAFSAVKFTSSVYIRVQKYRGEPSLEGIRYWQQADAHGMAKLDSNPTAVGLAGHCYDERFGDDQGSLSHQRCEQQVQLAVFRFCGGGGVTSFYFFVYGGHCALSF